MPKGKTRIVANGCIPRSKNELANKAWDKTGDDREPHDTPTIFYTTICLMTAHCLRYSTAAQNVLRDWLMLTDIQFPCPTIDPAVGIPSHSAFTEQYQDSTGLICADNFSSKVLSPCV